ncbi:phage tail tape measure protein [Weissella confusa]|uniref:phage tail tape measure protein n=1 Tax=Weissella confusa TaxID=1583 RepID=UPI0013E0DBC0|nr:phage tail tape measure protein [Weissella confusa]QIE78913.1 hypothetical protein G4V46_06595 [Weissella confusa]
MAGSRIKGITIDIDGNTTGLQSSLKDVNSQTSKTSAELRDVNKLLKLDPGNVELVAQKQKLLSNAVQTTSQKLDQLKSAQSQVEAQFKAGDIGEEQYRGFQREVQATEAQLGRLKSGLQDTTNYLQGSGDAAAQAEAGFKQAKSGMDELNDTAENIKNMGLADALGQVGDKAAEIGGDILNTGMDFANAQSLMQNSMGLTKSQADQATQSVHGVFNSGLVEDVNEASEAVMTVKNSFQDLNGQDLTNLTNQLVAIAKHGGVDIKDATNAASQAMKGFEISGQEATDVVAKGLQDGLNKNDDFLDTVNEYSPTFQDAGMSAGNMLNVLNAGMQNGAFNTDKVADAVKEFQLRLTSGQLDEPMQQFGQATQDVFQKFKDGQATSAEVMSAVGKDLKGMPADQAKAAVQDLGQGASAALLEAATGTEKVNGAADKMAQKTPGEKMQASINQLKDALANLVSQLAPVIDFISQLVTSIANAPGPIQAIIGVIGAVLAVLAILMPVITTIATIVGAFGAGVLLPIVGIIAGVIAAISAIVIAIQNWGAIVEWLDTVWAKIKVAINYAIFEIQNTITTVFTAIGSFFSGLWAGIQNVFSTVWNAISSTVSGVANAISSTISNVFNAISSTIRNIINGIRSTISSVWNGISSTTSSVWNGIRSAISNIVNGIRSTISNVLNSLGGIASGAFNGVRNAASNVLNGALNVVSGIVNRIKGLFNFSLRFPSISIPHIPLPYFSLSGSFNPLKGQIPRIGVNWYAKGGIFTKPTLFAANGGYNGVGEAGPEAALPLNDKTLGGIGKGIVDALGGEMGGTQIVIQVNADTTPATINKIRDAVMDGITRSQAAKARVTGA